MSGSMDDLVDRAVEMAERNRAEIADTGEFMPVEAVAEAVAEAEARGADAEHARWEARIKKELKVAEKTGSPRSQVEFLRSLLTGGKSNE